MSAMQDAAVRLQPILEACYRSRVRRLERNYEHRTVADFLVVDGMKLQVFKWLVSPEEVRKRALGDIAEELATRIADVEQAMILGAGGNLDSGGDALPAPESARSSVVRCFLEGCEIPQAHAIVPPHVSWHGTDPEDGIKVRHNFGVAVAVPA